MTKINRQPLPPARSGGTLDKAAAEKLVKSWSSSPIDPQTAQRLTSQAQSLDFGNDAARKVVQHFLEKDLPKLVKSDAPNAPDRSFAKDIATKSWSDSRIDKGEAKALAKQWGQPMARVQAFQLQKEIEQAEPMMDKGAKKVLKKFVEKTLPKEIKDPDYQAQFAKVAADGKITADEVKGLTKEWKSKGQLPLAQVEQIAENAKKYGPQMDAKAAKVMAQFVDKTLPSLILRQDLANPHSVELKWDPPTKNTDGTPLTDLAGYKLLRGTQPGVYTDVESVTDPAAKTFTMHNVPSGTYYFVAKSVDAHGNESGPSNEASATVP